MEEDLQRQAQCREGEHRVPCWRLRHPSAGRHLLLPNEEVRLRPRLAQEVVLRELRPGQTAGVCGRQATKEDECLGAFVVEGGEGDCEATAGHHR